MFAAPPAIIEQLDDSTVLFLPPNIELPQSEEIPPPAVIVLHSPKVILEIKQAELKAFVKQALLKHDPASIKPDPPPVLNPVAVTVDPSVFVNVKTPVPELYEAPVKKISVYPVKNPVTLNVLPEFVVKVAVPVIGL